MNDFGTALAPAAAYLPTSNQNRNNLQWAVRLHNNSGYLFCSNYLYRNSKKDYKNVQFKVKLKDENNRQGRHLLLMAIQSEYGRCTIEICNSTAHLFSERREYPHLLLF